MSTGIIITWPKKRSLESYLEELRKAEENNLLIHYRVPSYPIIDYGAPCYMVHDGFIRGWLTTLGFSNGEDVIDPISKEPWPEGKYIVRSPVWHPVNPTPHKGFRGYRYLVTYK